jgi:hypothetical protein
LRTEIEKRITNANRANQYSGKEKITFKVSVRQAATYEAGSWTLNNDVDKRVATFETKVLRRLFGGIKVN